MTYQEIIIKAHSWLDTRFKHQGRIKKNESNLGGCDCLGLIMGLGVLAKNGKSLQEFDQINYPKLLTSNILLEQLDLLLDRSDKIKPGDILLIKINNWPQHLALVVEVDPCVVIHSYLQARKVVKQHLPKTWEENIIAVYSSN